MFKRRFTALCAIVFLFAISTVGFADPPRVSIQQQAELFRGFDEVVLGIVVHVVVFCGDGEVTLGGLAVDVRQSEFFSTNTDGILDETRQEQEVFIPGPFEPGDAVASAALECGGLLEGLDLGASIKIVDP